MVNVKIGRVAGVLFLLAMVASRPAFAQIDLTGMWAPIFHEDQVERIPGPDVGDYAGLPINDAARLRADSWDASLLTLPEHQCKPHPSTYGFRGVGNLRITQEVDEATQQMIAHPYAHPVAGAATDDLDGRPPASTGIRAAHLAGLLDRPLGRQRPDRPHHPPQGRLGAPQRRRDQRSRDDGGSVLSGTATTSRTST